MIAHHHRWAFALLLGSSGCAATGASLPPVAAPNEFPTQSELQSIARSAPSKVGAPPVVIVEQWNFEVADQPPPPEAQKAWREAIARATGAPPPRPDPALDCAAEQVARFALAHGGIPNERLLGFVTARCGATAPGVDTSVVLLESDANASDADMLGRMEPKIQGFRGSIHGSGARSGTWFHRSGGRAALAVVRAPSQVEMAYPAPPNEQGQVDVSGRVLVAYESLLALVNRGADGVAECTPRPVARPQFAFSCPMAPDDEQTWIEVLVRRPHGWFLTVGGRALVHRKDRGAIAFRELPPSSAPSSSLSQSLLMRVNQLRAAHGSQLLVEATKQSATNASVAPHMLAALENHDDTLAERIGMGLMAGWDVPVVIGDSGLYTAFHGQERDADRWIAANLERPMARHVLLDPKARQIAIGTARDTPQPGMGAVITTYAPFVGGDPLRESKMVKAALDAQRLRRQLPATADLRPDALDRAVARIQRGAEAADSLERAMADAREGLGRTVWGGYVVAAKLDRLRFPDELVQRHWLQVAIRVVHHRFPPSRWGFYLVLILATEDPSGPRTAQQRAPADADSADGYAAFPQPVEHRLVVDVTAAELY